MYFQFTKYAALSRSYRKSHEIYSMRAPSSSLRRILRIPGLSVKYLVSYRFPSRKIISREVVDLYTN